MQLLNGEHPGFCALCQRTSICVCQRCGDFYCSPQCQRKDWPRHRYICFPMPTLVRADISCRQLSDQESSNEGTESMSFNGGQRQNRKVPKIHAQQQQEQPSISGSRRNSQKENNGIKEKHTITSNVNSSAPLPKPNSRVILTGFRTPNRCYVCSMSEIDDYFEVAKKINQYGKTAPAMTELPKPHAYVIASRDEIMCRAVVLSVRDEKGIRVLFCDHGTTAVRHLSDLREITDGIVCLKQHTALVQLRNVDNYAITEPLMRYLAQFEDAEFEIRYANESGVKVELINWHTGKCLNNEIVEFSKNMEIYAVAISSGEKSDEASDITVSKKPQTKLHKVSPAQMEKQAVKEEDKKFVCREEKPVINDDDKDRKDFQNPKKSPSAMASSTPLPSPAPAPCTSKSASSTSKPALTGTSLAPVLVAPFKTRHFDVTATNFKVIVTDNSCLDYGYFGCIAESDLRFLVQVQEYLNDFTDTKEPYEPKLNEYCIALYENEWYRAKVTEIPDDKHFNVIYVDFTNENQLTKDDIRRYPADLTCDCRTTLCLIDGLPKQMTPVQVKFLLTNISYRSKITIDKTKTVNDEIVVVECSRLVEKILGLAGKD